MPRVSIAPLVRVTREGSRTDQDLVAVEAPLTIEVSYQTAPARTSPHPPAPVRTGPHPSAPARTSAHPPAPVRTSAHLGVFMRTPGDDEALALGWLFAEGVIRAASDVTDMALSLDADGSSATLCATLAAHIDVDVDALVRSGITSTACGLCGRLSIDRLNIGPSAATAVAQIGNQFDELIPDFTNLIFQLPHRLREAQAVFAETGGLHAAGLFDRTGQLLDIAEDVGRHNAVDKLVGRALIAGTLPLAADHILVVSGRVAYEIIQKAAMAGVRTLVAVGAPSSLAVQAARDTRIMLIGFAKDGSFNRYG